MAAGTMATAAGAAVLLYYLLTRRLAARSEGEVRSGNLSTATRSNSRRIARRPVQAPATWFEAFNTLSETLRFTYSETLGKWPIGDLAFGIKYLMRRQGNLEVASVYAGSDCVELKGPEIIAELNGFMRLVTVCFLFSKKPFPVFLECAGFSQKDVLLQKPKAGLLKPAFTIMKDNNSKSFLLLVRGTHSIKDTLTAATGAVVPFHHSILHEGGVSNLVLGYAHCGMVAAARWIAKLSIPFLLKALSEYPDFKVKIVGHSLGGGTAALLTYILREQKELALTTCVTFAPAACMTWDLAESGKHFITTVINGSDLVPTFSAASVDDLRSEVTASSWSNDLRDQVEHTRVLNVVFRSATALGTQIANAKTKVSGAGALLRPVSSGTQIVMRRAQNVAQAVVRTRTSLTSWSCIGARRRNVCTALKSQEEDMDKASLVSGRTMDSLETEGITGNLKQNEVEYSSSNGGSGQDDTDEDEPMDTVATTTVEEITEGEFWYKLKKELRKEVETAAKEISEEENMISDALDSKESVPLVDAESVRFFPPGRIMHIVSIPSSGNTDEMDQDGPPRDHVGIYETPRHLYSKLRLSKTMIKDHYMPMYKKMMELVVEELERSDHSSISVV